MNILARAAQMSASSTDVAKLFDDDDSTSLSIQYPAYKPIRFDESTSTAAAPSGFHHARRASEQITHTATVNAAATSAPVSLPAPAPAPSAYTFASSTFARAAAPANANAALSKLDPSPASVPAPPPVELQLSSGSSLASLAATNGGSATSPLRVPLLEEEIRLLRQNVTDISAQKDNYKEQIYALEKKLLDLREEARDYSERLEERENTLEDWRYRDGQMEVAAAQREQDWNARMAAKEAEIAKATRKIHEQEDALYRERTALAELKTESSTALQQEQQYRAELEEQLKKQIRGVCIERNELAAQLKERTEDLAAAQKTAKTLADDKLQLFEQIYAQSRIGPEHVPQRECKTAEAALLDLQKKEIDTLRARVDKLNEEHASRLTALRVELRSSVLNEGVQRDKVAELKSALKKCMSAMDEQREEIDAEKRELDKLRKELEEQRNNIGDQQADAMVARAQQQAQAPPATTTEAVAYATPAIAPSVPTTTTLAPASSASSTFHTLSSHEVLAQTRLLLEQEQIATEQRRQRREERRAAINNDEPITERKYAEPAATVAAVAAVPVAQPIAQPAVPAPAPQPVSSAATVEALTSRAPVVISAQLPPAPAPAPPVPAPAVYAPPTLLSGAPVTFDFSFMNSDIPRRPFTQVTLDGTRKTPLTSSLRSSEQEAETFEQAADAQLRRALEHAMREVENDHRKRHGEQHLPSAQHRYTTTLESRSQPQRQQEFTTAEDRATLEYALDQLARLQQRQAEEDEAEAHSRPSRPSSGAARKNMSTQAASATRLSSTNKIAAPASRSASIKKRSSLTTPASAIGQRRADSTHSIPRTSAPAAPVYKPATEILIAAGEDEELTPDVGSGYGAARTPGSMAPLRHVIPTGHPAVPRLQFPAPLSPQQQRRQAVMYAEKRGGSRPASAGRTTFGSGREPAKQSDATEEPHGALGKVTSSLRKVAASLKKHKQPQR